MTEVISDDNESFSLRTNTCKIQSTSFFLLFLFASVLLLLSDSYKGIDAISGNNAFAITGSGTTGTGGPLATHGSITGYVHDAATNNGITGARVSALMEADFKAEALDATTHEIKGQSRIYLIKSQTYVADTRSDGFYTINNVPPGTYKIWADAMESGYVKTYYDGVNGPPAGIPLEVNQETSTSRINFSLVKGGVISGLARQGSSGQPIADLTIVAYNHLASIPDAETNTRADGSYSLAGLLPGQYSVKADGKAEYASLYFDGKADRTQASLIAVNTNTPINNIDFTITAFGSVTGIITKADSSAVPLAGVLVNVYLFPSDLKKSVPVRQGITKQDGSYIINRLPPRSYKIVATPPNSYVKKIYGSNLPGEPAIPVAVEEGQVTTDIHFALEAGGTISGFITDENSGRPLVNAKITIYDSSGENEIISGRTNETGFYSIYQLGPGSYRISAHFANHVDEYFDNTTNAGQSLEITLGAGQTRSDVDFQLALLPSLPPGSISGAVVGNLDDQPLANICVSAFQWTSNQIYGQDCSNLNGRYFINGLIPGQYRICAKPKTNYTEACHGTNNQTVKPENATPVTLDGVNQLTGVNLKLRKFGKVSGTLFRSRDGQSIGTYIIPNLEPGFYHIRINPETTGYKEKYFDNIVNVTTAALVEVREDQETPNIDFNLEVAQ